MDLDVWWNITGFLVCSVTIYYAGSKLSEYGNLISELTGLGKAWMGLIIMATITSLPELITGISSVSVVSAPDLAAGDVFGSCVFNLLILSIIDLSVRRPITSLISASHLYAGLVSIILLAACCIFISYGDQVPDFGGVSPFSYILIGLYFISIRSIHRFDNQTKRISTVTLNISVARSLKKILIRYMMSAFVVISAALFLPKFGEKIAQQTGLGNTFFGTLFLAAATSLPELSVSLSCVKLKAFDIAVGNILGSNIFNVFVLALDDFFYKSGSLFAHISGLHMTSIFFLIIMSSVTGLGVLQKSGRTFWKLGWDTLIIVILYITLLIILYTNS